MITTLVRTLVLFSLTIVVMRAMGKRQLAQLQPFEIVITLMIAELAALPIGTSDVSLLSGVTAILTLLFAHALICALSLKSQRFRSFICGKPAVLMRHGQLQEHELKRLCFDINDLFEAMRAQGILNIADVESVILETSGALNVFPKSSARPPMTQELGLSPAYEGIPLVLVLDGAVQEEALSLAGLSRQWLLHALNEVRIPSPGVVLLASLDTQGRLFVQEKGPRTQVHLFKALDEKSVSW